MTGACQGDSGSAMNCLDLVSGRHYASSILSFILPSRSVDRCTDGSVLQFQPPFNTLPLDGYARLAPVLRWIRLHVPDSSFL